MCTWGRDGDGDKSCPCAALRAPHSQCQLSALNRVVLTTQQIVFAIADEGRTFQARAATTGRRGRRVLRGTLTARSASMLKQTGDELLHQSIFETSE